MITPGLLRRSLVRAAQWRLLLFTPAALLLPALVAWLPLARFFGGLFDHAPRWKELAARLEGPAFAGVIKQLAEPGGQAIPGGVQAGLLAALLLFPLTAGAALAAARSDETLDLRELCTGAAEHYGRLLRFQLAALLPFGVATGVAAAGYFWAGKAVARALTEASAAGYGRLALGGTVVAFFVANLVADAGRAWFAAQPTRRSAFFALGAGLGLVVRRPLRAVSVGAVTWLLGAAVAAVIVAARQRVGQGSGGGVLLALLLGQAAVAAIGWGRTARLLGFAELARADAAQRARAASFEMAPPKTSPPPIQAQPVQPLAAVPPPVAAPVHPAEQQLAPLGGEPFPSPGLQAVVAAEAVELASADAARAAAAAAPPLPPVPAEAPPRVEEGVALGPVGFAPDPGAQAGSGGPGPAGGRAASDGRAPGAGSGPGGEG